MPKFPLTSLSKYVIRNPFTTAAAVFTPIFAQNEDRGYFRTALVTTPIIFASGEFVPKLFGGVRDLAKTAAETSSLLKKSEKWMRFEQTTFNDVNTLYKTPGASQNTIERALSSYLVNERRSRDFLKEQKVLNKYFNRRFVKTADLIGKAEMGDLEALARVQEIEQLQLSKGRLITNALHTARRSSLTPLEWANESSGALPDLDNAGMIEMFNQYQGRPEFVKTLKNRLREVGRLNYSGSVDITKAAELETINTALEFGFGDKAEMQLQRQAPGVYKNLQEAQKMGFVKDINLQVEVAKDASGKVLSGEVGRIFNVSVTRRQGQHTRDLVIPIVDPATGSVRLGGNAIGVGNYVIGPDAQSYRIDEWIAKQLAENPKFTNEQLQEEIAAHAYWQAGDPLDSRRLSELRSLQGESAVMNSRAIKLRSYGAGVTKLPLFDIKGKPGSFYDYAFGAPKKVSFIRDLLNTNRFMSMGSEAGIYEGRFQLREAANLSPIGAPSAEKQDSIWRSVTKEFQLATPSGMPEEARPNWRSTAWETLTGSPDLPGAKFTVASLSPQDRTVFSELPGKLEDLEAQRGNVIQKFMDRKMSESDATAMFEDVRRMYQEGRQGVLSNLGRMGETGYLVNESFANNFQVEGTYKYNVDELGVKAGDYVDPEDVMGFNRGDRVLPKFQGQVVDVSKGEEGFVVNVRHSLPMQGAKLDIAGIKGMVPVTPSNEHFSELRQLMNSYYQRTGSGDIIPENVNVLAPAEYFASKVDPAHAYLGIGSDVVNRLEAAGAGGVASQYLAELGAEGIDYEGGQLVINAGRNAVRDSDAASRLLRLSEINEAFFAKAGEAIRSAGGYEDPVLSAFVHSGKDLGNYMMRNQLPAIGFTWDHSMANVPKFSSISYDVETYMALGGNLRGLKAMQGRLQTVSGGDANQARDFLGYFMGGDFSKEMGVTVPLKEAFQSSGSLTQAGNLAGSIFDPSIDSYKKNFRVDLGGGRFLPVPGTEAYGAEGSLYGPGEYSPKAWRKGLQDLAFAETPEAAAEAEARVRGSYIEEFGVGKGSALRPYQFDPLAVPGFLSTSAEQGDPFVARVSEEWVSKVRSKRLRKALMQGEDVVGMIQRQPTNELLYMKYRLDTAMQGTMDVAVPEQVSRALMGDQDKDLINNILFDANLRTENGKMIVSEAGSRAEREAAEEALEAMSGKQQKQLSIWQSIKGDEEIAARVGLDWEGSTLSERTQKFAKGVANRTGVAVNRTAGASIGAYSNVLTEMVEDMVRNPAMMRDPDRVQRLKTGLFDIRQAPISARKAHVSFSLETAMQKIDMLRKGLAADNPETAFGKIHTTLLSLTETLMTGGRESKEYKYWAEQGAEDLKAWAAGRSDKARLMTAVFTAGNDRAGKLLPQVFREGLGEVLGPIHGGRMAQQSATQLGMLSESLAERATAAAGSATGKMGRIFAEHGGKMALGLGAMAALGIALTPKMAPVATFSRGSGNKFRPEERMGVADSIPGEPVAGQMAPSMPPRRIEAGQPGVRTAVVASMNQTSDLSVRMRATDHSRAAETARQISQMPGSGDTNVTVNYRDRTKLRSLRTREKIRDINA